MFSIRKGVPVTSESASAVRTICPPPSPMDPSMVNTQRLPLALDAHDLVQRVDNLDELPLGLHHRIDRLVRAGGLVQDALVLPTLHSLRRLDVILHGEGLRRLRS